MFSSRGEIYKSLIFEKFFFRNILEDNPRDQSSRWSSETNTPPQYVILKLEKPAVVTKITFGKYERSHSCNLKHFKVFGMVMTSTDQDKSHQQHHNHQNQQPRDANSTSMAQNSNGSPNDFANDNNTLMLIDSVLKNDTIPESFRLKHVINDHYLPVNYVKIVPLECWKPNFNFSIWYVALEGDDSPDLARASTAWHDQVSSAYQEIDRHLKINL